MECLETSFLYPDGSSVDLHLIGGSLTDVGKTAMWISSVSSFEPSENVLKCYGVERAGAQLLIRGVTDGNIDDATMRLGQACVSVSWMAMTADRHGSADEP